MKKKLISVMGVVLALVTIITSFAGVTASAEDENLYFPEEYIYIASAEYKSKAVKLTFDYGDGLVNRENAEGVYVYRSEKGTAGTWTRIATTKSANEYTDKTALPNKTYWYTVKAYANIDFAEDGGVKKVIESSKSKISVSTALERPAFTLAGNSGNGVLLKWAKENGMNGVAIYRSATGKAGSWTKIKTVKTANAGSFTDTNVTIGETYYYCFKFYSTVGKKNYYSPSSKAYKITIKDVAIPENLVVEATSEGMQIYFSKVPATKGYVIYRSLSGEKGTWKRLLVTTSNNATSYLDKDVVNGVEYYYTVKSYKTLNGKNIYSQSADAYCEKCKKGELTISLSVAEISFSELLEKQTVMVSVDGAPKYDSLKFEIGDVGVAKASWGKVNGNESEIVLTRIGPGETTLKVYYDNYPESAVTINVIAYELDLDDDYMKVQDLVAEAYKKFDEVLNILQKLKDDSLSDIQKAELIKEVKDKISEASVLLGEAAELAEKYADYSTDNESIASLQKLVSSLSTILNDWVNDDSINTTLLNTLIGYLNQILKSAGIK